MTTATHNAFASDGPHSGSDPDTGDDWTYGWPGITVEDAEGREVAGAGKDFRWPSGKFDSAFADETLGRMGFRRIGPWESLNPDWRAPLAAITKQAQA
jgi:hypothetical protein